jgi:hypothetical protein
MLLKVDLQDGFSGDLVIIKIGEMKVFRREDVTTKLMLGYAGSLTLEVPEGQVNIDVSVPTRKLSNAISIDTSKPTYLGLSIENGEIRCSLSEEPFAYF